jgi:hypothetical protein
MSPLQVGPIILGVVLFLSAALMYGMRMRAERMRLKLLKAQEAEQPLRRAVLDAQVAGLKSEEASASTSLLRRTPVPSSVPPAESDPYWDSLLQFADVQ